MQKEEEFMKRLKYNKITKEIDIKKSVLKKMKSYIEKNEKILSFISSVILGLASLLISINTMCISCQQLGIEKDSIGAQFKCEIECIGANTEENKQQYLYTIKNTGGRITSATARVRKYIEPIITHIEGIEIGPIVFRAPIYDGDYIENVGDYDENSKSFYLLETDRDKDLYEDYLVLGVEIASLMDSDVVVNPGGIGTYIEISYNNFQDEHIENRYKIYYHKKMVPEKNNNDVIYIYLDEINKNNIKNIARQAKLELDRILQLE